MHTCNACGERWSVCLSHMNSLCTVILKNGAPGALAKKSETWSHLLALSNSCLWILQDCTYRREWNTAAARTSRRSGPLSPHGAPPGRFSSVWWPGMVERKARESEHPPYETCSSSFSPSSSGGLDTTSLPSSLSSYSPFYQDHYDEKGLELQVISNFLQLLIFWALQHT